MTKFTPLAAFKSGKKIPLNLSIILMYGWTYLSVNWRSCYHLNIKHSFVIIHPLHPWELNLPWINTQLFHTKTHRKGRGHSREMYTEWLKKKNSHQGWAQSSSVEACPLTQADWMNRCEAFHAASKESTEHKKGRQLVYKWNILKTFYAFFGTWAASLKFKMGQFF